MEAQDNDTLPPDEASQDEEDAIRRKLVNRIAIAGVVIVALLGGLAIVDALYVPPPPAPPAQMATMPEPDAETRKEEVAAAEPDKDKQAPSEAAKEEDKPAAASAAAEPEKTEVAVENKGSKGIKPITPPADAKPATMASGLKGSPATPTSPIATTPIAAAPRAEPGKEVAQRQPARPIQQPAYAHNAPASRPLSQAAQSDKPVPAEQQNRFLVQMGVFNNVANAEELRAKLELAGVPARIEARVQVGPFGSREEAEAARVKIAALGLDPGILMATKK